MNERQELPISTESDGAEYDSLTSRFKFEAIVDVLKARFPDYSDAAPSLTTLSPELELATLRQIFNFACRASSFENFCDELDAFWASRDSQTKQVDEKQRRELITAQLFNNFVVKILEERRKIGSAFLRRYVAEISPEVAQELEFDAYSTEPTVHIFGAQVSRLCDLVFSIPFKERSQGSLAVVVPMEHKSTQTRDVVFQLLTSLVLVLQYIQGHKERFQRKDRKFVWSFLMLFYTGARPWKRVLNFRDLYATPSAALDKRWIFKLRFKFVGLFRRLKRRSEADPWLDAFLELTKAAEKIVAKKDATPEDWKKAWKKALRILEGKVDSNEDEDVKIFDDFIVFVNKVTVRKDWELPSREEVTQFLGELGGAGMKYKFDSFYDLGRMNGWEDGRASGWKDGRASGWEDGRASGLKEGVRNMLKQCITSRFPQIAQTTMNSILSITDVDVLESIFKVACNAKSLDNFQRDVRGIAPVF